MSINSCGEQAYSRRPLQRDYWDRRLGRVHKNESLTHTQRLHRICRRFGIYLAEDLRLFVKGSHLRRHKLGLNFYDILKILGLAKFLHEGKSSSNALRRLIQKYSI